MSKESGWLPTEREITDIIMNLDASGNDIAKLTAKKIAERGNETCPHYMDAPPIMHKRECSICWQSLLKEVEES